MKNKVVVNWRETVCVNYQSQTAEVQLEVLEGWTVEETYDLAKYLVRKQLDNYDLTTRHKRQGKELEEEYFE